LVEANRFGEKNKKGFYKYEGKNVLKDEEVYKMVEKSRKDFQKNYPSLPKNYSFSDEDIVNMIQFSIINESCRCLDESIAIRSSDIDVCSVFGYGILIKFNKIGYPSYRGINKI
jgi:3-hydroxyacyl-CoA dehydrogenase